MSRCKHTHTPKCHSDNDVSLTASRLKKKNAKALLNNNLLSNKILSLLTSFSLRTLLARILSNFFIFIMASFNLGSMLSRSSFSPFSPTSLSVSTCSPSVNVSLILTLSQTSPDFYMFAVQVF